MNRRVYSSSYPLAAIFLTAFVLIFYTVTSFAEKSLFSNPETDASPFVQKMIEFARDNDKLLAAKVGLDALVKPQAGDKTKARKLNDDALALMRAKKNTEAVTILEEAHKIDPGDVEITNNLASAYFATSFEANDFSKNKALLVETLTLKSDRAVAWANLGYSFAMESNETAASNCFINYYRFTSNKQKALSYLEKGMNDQDPRVVKAFSIAYDFVNSPPSSTPVLNSSPNATPPVIEPVVSMTSPPVAVQPPVVTPVPVPKITPPPVPAPEIAKIPTNPPSNPIEIAPKVSAKQETSPPLDLKSRNAIIAQQAPEKVYALLAKTPERMFAAITSINPGRQVPLGTIDIPEVNTTLSIATIPDEVFPNWNNVQKMDHATAGHCYYIGVTPQFKDGSYDQSTPLNNMGAFSNVLCFDGETPYILRGSEKTFVPLDDKDSFIDSYVKKPPGFKEHVADFLKNFGWWLSLGFALLTITVLGKRYPDQRLIVFSVMRSTWNHLTNLASSITSTDSIRQMATLMSETGFEKIAAIEQPIKSSGNFGLTRYFWGGVPLDGLILSSPSHDGTPVEIARQVYHRLLARMVAGRVFSLQTTLVVLSIVVTLFFGGVLSPKPEKRAVQDFYGNVTMQEVPGSQADMGAMPYIAGFIGAAVFIGFFAPAMTRNALSQKMIDETSAIIYRTFLRPLPDGAPRDLRDEFQLTWLTLDGRPLSSDISAEDGKSTEALSRSRWWLGTALSIGFAVGSLFTSPSSGLLGGITNSLYAGIPLIIFISKIILDRHPLAKRATELELAEAIEGSAFIAAGGVPWGAIPETARRKQIDIATRDKTPIIEFGTATGLFAARGDFFAPNGGLPFVLSLRDLQNHLLVLGGVGSGKTSGVLRPIAQQIGGFDNVGLIVLDGKGALPRELDGIPGLTLIDPATASVSLVADLEPTALVDTIVEILAPPSTSGDRFWVDSAAGLLRRSAVLAQAAGDAYWSLDSAARVAINEPYRNSVILAIAQEKGNDPVLLEALEFFKVEWTQIEDRTKSSIIATMRAWTSALTASPDLLRWAKTLPSQDSVDITSPLRGGRIGLVLPDYRYGSAGAVVTALLKARIYARLKARADQGMAADETPVVFLIDEAQEVATKEDATMLAIGRSLELAVIAATQSIEGIKVKLGEQVSRKWLSIYGNVIALPGRSKETDDFVAARGGESWKASIADVHGLPVRDSLTVGSISGAMAAARRQPHMRGVMSTGNVTLLPSRIQTMIANTVSGMLPGRETPARVSLGVRPIIVGSEIGNILAEPDTAIVLATRARAPRRDVIRLKPVYPSSR